MPDDPTTQSDPRIETGSRARELPKEAHLTKRFGNFQDFVDMYRSRISLGGAFIDTEVLRPVGTEVYLDFRLEDGYRLMYGLAEVVWVRLATMSDERPKGMGLRFLSLDESGRELVLKLLEEQVKSGGAPFEVDRVPEDGSIDPTVVQALAGPSAEENEAAQRAKTGSRPAEQPDSEAGDGEELPDLPPGVLPPPDDEEPDFRAPWGSQLPEIPDELLEESSAAPPDAAPDGPSIPAVEAPESPYAPGSDSHDDEAEQADFAFEPPTDDGGDPLLDETDFGATAAVLPPDPSQDVKPVGGVTSLQEAQGGDPFSDFDDESVPEVDGTLFQLPDSAPADAAVPAEEPAAAESAEPAASFEEPAADEPSFDAAAAEEPSFEAPSFAADAPADAPSFDGVDLDTGGFDTGGSDDGGFDAGGLDDIDFGDDTSSQVAPPPDIGDAAGRAWDEDFDASGTSATASSVASVEPSPPAALEPPAEATEASAADAAPASFADPVPPTPTPTPNREESVAMDAAMDIDADDFAFEPPDTDLLDGEADAPALSDRSDVATPESVAAAALANQMVEDERPSQFETQPSPPPAQASSTETADDLFAFRGPADAQPALDPEETASLRKGALPDLSDTVMGTKAAEPSGQDGGGEDLQHSYDDWEDWAPHPSKSGGRTKMLIGVVLLVLLVGGASYFFRSTLLPMIGFGGDSADPTELGAPAPANDGVADDGIVEYEPPDDPLAEPVEVAEPDADPNAGSAAGEDDEPPQTQATAESLRPPSTRPDPPPPQASAPASQPPPPPRPTTRPPPSSASTSGPASRIQSIEIRPGAGSTEVVVQLDGIVGAGRFTHDPLAWAPDRERVKLHGFENFEQTQIAGRGSHVKQIRVGFHPGKELHLVFDLVTPSVTIQDVQARGNQIVVRLGG